MTGTVKNYEKFQIGTRVRPYGKVTTRRGTVVEHSEEPGFYADTVVVLWDGDALPMSGYMVMELRKAEE